MGKRRKSAAKKRQEEALFRYQVVSRVLALELGGSVYSDAVRSAADEVHLGPDGGPRRVSVRTLYRWLATYRDGGTLACLAPAERHRTTTSSVLPERFIAFIREETALDPRASAPELIRRAELCGVLDGTVSIARAPRFGERVGVWASRLGRGRKKERGICGGLRIPTG